MTEITEQLCEGDVFRWRYRDPNTDNRQYGSYHCCSRIAVVHRGLLRDTFWQIGTSFSDGKSFATNDLPKLELSRICNLSEIERAPEYQADYYDDADIVDLNHSNSTRGNFYLRKGAVRSQKKMLEVARAKLDSSLSDVRMAHDRSKRMREAISKIEAGQTDIYL